MGSIPSQTHQEEAGGFPALPEAPAEDEASGEALCAGADTARQQGLSPGSGTVASFGRKPWPQPDADGGAGSLNPRSAISSWAVAGVLSFYS